jgi:hypothetical protein
MALMEVVFPLALEAVVEQQIIKVISFIYDNNVILVRRNIFGAHNSIPNGASNIPGGTSATLDNYQKMMSGGNQ